MTNRISLSDRAAACIKALAIGDAIGKQTETLSRSDVLRWYPNGITGFEGRPGDVIPRYAGKRYEWRIGETTDDTEQTLAVLRAILRGTGHVRHDEIGRELLQCKKSLHPGVSLWDFVQANDPARVATSGDGCGAAMRIAPVGILHRSNDLDSIRHATRECSIPTHGGPLAISAAAAVAGAISAALEGKSPSEVLAISLATAQPGQIADAIAAIHADLSCRPALIADDLARDYSPNQPLHIVPLAIALALVTRSARETTLLAANTGGDADSVASIGAAIAGALVPHTVDESWFSAVAAVNSGSIRELRHSTAQLAILRSARRANTEPPLPAASD